MTKNSLRARRVLSFAVEEITEERDTLEMLMMKSPIYDSMTQQQKIALSRILADLDIKCSHAAALFYGYENIPLAATGNWVGDPATLCYPSDRYPYVICNVTAKGRTIHMRLLADRPVSREAQIGMVHSYTYTEAELDDTRNYLPRIIEAHWSAKKQVYMWNKSIPVAVGGARYYRDYGD